MDDKSLSEPIKNKQMKSQVCSQNSPLGADRVIRRWRSEQWGLFLLLVCARIIKEIDYFLLFCCLVPFEPKWKIFLNGFVSCIYGSPNPEESDRWLKNREKKQTNKQKLQTELISWGCDFISDSLREMTGWLLLLPALYLWCKVVFKVFHVETKIPFQSAEERERKRQAGEH